MTLEDWHQIDGEPQAAFDAFVTFLGLGPTRTIAKAAEAGGLEINTLYIHAAQFKWRVRAKFYDDEKGDSLLEMLMDERKISASENNKVARLMKQKAIKFLIGDPTASPPIPGFEFNQLAPKEAARLLPQWVKAFAELEAEAKDRMTYDLEFYDVMLELKAKIAAWEESHG